MSEIDLLIEELEDIENNPIKPFVAIRIGGYLRNYKYHEYRIAELEALVERLIETGKQSMNFTEGFCNNADRDKPEYWHNWNAIVEEYKECEK